MKPKTVETRKYSKFDSEQFRNDLQSMPFDEIKNFTADPYVGNVEKAFP